jgi:uncharacterized membrane protein
MKPSVEEFIEHHGVRGMRWGVRKARGGTKPSSDYKKTAPLRKKKPHELTNKQLKSVNERANLEKNFRQLNPKTNKAAITAKKGKIVAAELLAAAGMATAAYNFYHSKAGQAAIQVVNEALKKKGPTQMTGWY